MLEITKRLPIALSQLSQSQAIKKLGINPSTVGKVLGFEGSITKFMLSVGEKDCKPLMINIHQNQLFLRQLVQRWQKGKQTESGSTLCNLGQVMFLSSHQNDHLPISSPIGSCIGSPINPSISPPVSPLTTAPPQKIIQLQSDFYIDSPLFNFMFYSRSFWHKQQYTQIMLKPNTQPICTNLIEKNIEVQRKVNWTGLVDLEVEERDRKTINYVTEEDLLARSYSIVSRGEVLCEVEEFFKPQMFKLMQKRS